MGPSGQDIAATRIQSLFRMHHQRLIYLAHRHKKWAAGVIAISWIMHVKMSMVRKQLKVRRADQLEASRRRYKVRRNYGLFPLHILTASIGLWNKLCRKWRSLGPIRVVLYVFVVCAGVRKEMGCSAEVQARYHSHPFLGSQPVSPPHHQ